MAAPLLSDWLGPVMAGLTLPVLVGAQHLASQDAPPRVIWVPSVDTFEGALQGGTSRHTVVLSVTGFDVHLWGASHDEARELRRKLLVTLYQQLPGAHRVLGGEWFGVERPAWLRKGEAYVLRVAIVEGVDDAPWTTVQPDATAFDASAAVAGDGVLTAGETS